MEVCVDTIDSVINATKGGCQRLELCSSLKEGGLTPSIGFLKIARQKAPSNCKIFVMIRPRAFDFNYSLDELHVMMEDIKIFKQKGADGFVFGCLNTSKEINVSHCKELLAVASPLPCTFHRAFDEAGDPIIALEKLEKLGFKRILTSGQKETALLGKDTVRSLVEICRLYDLRVKIMPGGGIDESNLETILQYTGAREFHGSAKTRNTEQDMYVTSEDKVREMIKIGNKFGCSYT